VPALPPYNLPKNAPRVDQRPDEFRKAIHNKGLNVTWEQSAVCPCGRSSAAFDNGSAFGFDPAASLRTTGESRTDCALCHGHGYVYHSPTPTTVLINGRSSDPKRFEPQGEMGHGSVGITFLPENPPSFMDRVTLVDSAVPYRQIATRAAGTTSAMRYGVVRRAMKLGTGDTTIGVLYGLRANASGVVTSDDVLTEGVDFTVTTGGLIDWTLGIANGKAPAVGSRFSLTYFAHPRYVLTSVPFSQRDTWILHKHPTAVYVELPIRTSGRLEYLGGVING
jgi:hypothetical protein